MLAHLCMSCQRMQSSRVALCLAGSRDRAVRSDAAGQMRAEQMQMRVERRESERERDGMEATSEC